MTILFAVLFAVNPKNANPYWLIIGVIADLMVAFAAFLWLFLYA